MADYFNPFSTKASSFAKQFDEAFDKKDASAIKKLIDSAKQSIDDANLPKGQVPENNASKAKICYSIATSYGDLGQVTNKSNDEELVKQQLFYYRESIRFIEIDEYNQEQYAPYILAFKQNLYINYGNTLKLCGRFISAIEQYLKALNINRNNGMALGNLGQLYQQYACLVYNEFHRDYLHYFAYHNLREAVESSDPNLYEQARQGFAKLIDYYNDEYINEVLLPDLNIPDKDFETTEESLYRQWGLKHHLFLNPLNNLPVIENYFAADEINLPNMIAKIDDKPIFHGMFNQIKQEYVYARYLYYSSLHCQSQPHFADKDTKLINLSDFPQYSIRIEKLKASFKTLYGLFDKIAYFINSYYKVGMPLESVSFHRIWSFKGNNSNPILNPNTNIALAALYWIDKDVSKEAKNSPNPYLERIRQIRNGLEHKYVKIVDDVLCDDYESGKYDDLVLYVSESEMYDITLHLLKLLQESIICLSLCVNIEEKRKSDNLPPDTMICPISFIEYEDDWKI